MSLKPFVDVLLPFALKPLTYSIGAIQAIQPGNGVLVPLKNKFWSAIVLKCHDQKPSYAVKTLWGKICQVPIFTQKQLTFFDWMANYYLTSLGETIAIAMPKALHQLQDISFEIINPIPHFLALNQSALTIFNALTVRALSYKALKKLVGKTLANQALFDLLFHQVIRPLPLAIPIDKSFHFVKSFPLATLTEAQTKTFLEIKTQFLTKDVVLCHGIIGSGKTQLYLHLIEEALLNQKQVLLLLPEIGLVMHMMERITPLFKDYLVIFHSKQSAKEQFHIWAQVYHGYPLLVIGTRSAIFLPFKQLQLIIIDEEHDTAYKQTDKPPMYHARECSILLAKQHHAKVLLGSATPAIETYYNAQIGKYGLATLSTRFGKANSPKLTFIDLNVEKRRQTLREHFSFTMLAQLTKTILSGGQAMVFQNRRGYARYFLCESCGWIPHCITCAVSLTYHQSPNLLICHYCNYTIAPVSACQHCGSKKLHHVGMGTEKLEETLQLIFPSQHIGRMDLDNTKSKKAYQRILSKFSSKQIDILVGTQMIAKGLDFDNIQLIGVLDIDSLLYFPDFRSNERCFQLIAQLAGRAGRRHQQGYVLIQTRQPQNPLFAYLARHDYQAMYDSELAERKQFLYPPYVRLIRLILRCKTEAILESEALKLKKLLKQAFGSRVLGPQQPLITKIQNIFSIYFLIKVANNSTALEKTKLYLQNLNQKYRHVSYKTVQILIDVDPL